MNDVLTMEPNIPKPEFVDPYQRWCWCRWGSHWYSYEFRRGANPRVVNSCLEHRDEYNYEYARRNRARIAEQMEMTEGAGKAGAFDFEDYRWAASGRALNMNANVVEPQRYGHRSSINLPHADDELACGCVPGWNHGTKCSNSLTGQPCRQPS